MEKIHVCLLLVLICIAGCVAKKHANDEKHHGHGHHGNKHHNKHGQHKVDHSHHHKGGHAVVNHHHKQPKTEHSEAQPCVKKPFTGCNINYIRGKFKCVCSKEKVWGCKNPFHYKSWHQCHKDQRGNLDRCKHHPCVNGECVQIEKNKWACSCAGTGFYGKTCNAKCPPKYDGKDKSYPPACIY